MKTKEITAFIDRDVVTNLINDSTFYSEVSKEKDADHDFEIKILVPVPEKKIEITESKFWEAVNELKNEYGGISGPDILAQKLFGKEEK